LGRRAVEEDILSEVKDKDGWFLVEKCDSHKLLGDLEWRCGGKEALE